MIRDFRSAPNGSKIETDLCIIGGGAAGIAIAHSLVGTSLSVTLVESGGLTFDPDTQALYGGEAVGVPWGVELTRTRLRWFGGSTNEWGRGCIPLDDIDFVERSWVPSSGWPFGRQELTKYYEKAHAFCMIPNFRFDAPELIDGLRPRLPSFDSKVLAHCYAMLSFKGGFGNAYAQSLKCAVNVEVLLHANLVELVPQESGRSVERASIRTLEGGKSGTICARWYVLACGGIENARLLLLSDSVTRSGLGNKHGVVGRYFMDHPNIHLGKLRHEAGMALAAPYIKRLRRRLPVWPVIRLSEDLQKQDGLLNGRFQLVVREEGEESEGMQALRALKQGVRQGSLSWYLGHSAYRAAIDWRSILPAVSRHIRGFPTSVAPRIDIEGFFEQAPNPMSRVELNNSRDALGLRKVRLDWRLTDLDHYSYRVAAHHFVQEVGRYFPGAIQLTEWLIEQQKRALPRGTAHHMGTTRMSNNPQLGVVDRDCRVHGLDNLYVAGSSVFPTSGWAFPTFTIIALALRLSEHIMQESRRTISGHRHRENGHGPAHTAFVMPTDELAEGVP